MTRHLVLRGAREHNLRGIDLDLPLGAWTAVVGPSGSGKTSLVVDVLVREGARRFLSGLSARARQFHGKLGRADVERLDQLPPAVAVGARTAGGDARSTVGTVSGTLDLLRLLYARAAVDPGGTELSRSHFSFNHPLGACEACGGLGLEDRVDPELLVADATRSIRAGALVPTLKNGYTVYSQVTVEVLERIARAHGFDLDTPWEALSDAQRRVVLFGTKKLKVPFGKHGLESRMKWEGITARPREEGYYRGLVPVIEETLQRNRNPNILRFVETVPCGACGGSRLARPGREAQVGEHTLPELLARPAGELRAVLAELEPTPVWAALRPGIELRLARMERLALGHLALDRPSPTLSGGEAQRLELVGRLAAGLGRQLIAFDEPTLGLHPEAQAGMRAVLDELIEQGNTLVVVEHDPEMVRHADWLVRLGPGAGSEGGEVLESGPLEPGDDVPDPPERQQRARHRTVRSGDRGPDGPLGGPPERRRDRRPGHGHLRLFGATLHNLDAADLHVRLGAFNVVIGPSGAGKSSLVFGTLLPALTGDGRARCRALEGAPAAGVEAVDARGIGRTPRSTPATWSGLFDLVRRRFAAEPAAVERGLGAGHFSYNNKAGRCPTCEGLGFRRVGLHLMEDVELDCPTCGGGRYAPEVLAVRHRGRTIAEVLALSVREAVEFFAGDAPLERLVRAMDDLGLGYLGLGHASNRLSRGEAQRVKLATLLGTTSAEPSLLLLDEPDRGLHPSDVERLLDAIDRLVDAGHTVVAISHHRHLWAAADFVTEVRDGRVRDDVEPDLSPLEAPRDARPAVEPPAELRLEGVRTHNLRGVDVTLPHGKLTAVVGVSGSGKSSLVFDTLAAEAWARYAESLPFQVRRFVRRAPRPDLEAAHGLAPTLALRQEPGRAAARSTVATQSELGPTLRLLWARAGRLDGRSTALTASHFSPDHALGACPVCEGRGRVPRASEERLVTHPDRPLADGALDGTRPGRFFGEPDGQYLATLRAALEAELGDARALDTPWRELPERAREIALHGTGGRVLSVEWAYTRGERSGTHRFEGPWEGLLALVEREARRRAGTKRADEWRAPLEELTCGSCGGSGLGPEAARVELGGWTLPAALATTVDDLGPALAALELDPDAARVRDALLPEVAERLGDLAALGLGHLTLDRGSRTLSDGELQRLRLAGLLRSGLTGVTFALDEPDAGLHPRDLEGLVARLRLLCEAGNTVVVVTHRPELLRAADHWIELGPGSGAEGGRVLCAGPAKELLDGDGPTARALCESPAALAPEPAGEAPPARFRVRGARAHNLASIDVELPAAGFVCLTGVSGSGKSSLLFDVLGASMAAGAPVECDAVEWVAPGGDGAHGRPPDGSPLAHFDALFSSREVVAGRTVLSSLGLMSALQSLFHGAAGDDGPKRAAFSYLSPAGRCEACAGSGRDTVALDVLADLELPCPACGGARYRPEVLAVRWNGRNVAEFLDRPVERLRADLPAGRLRAAADALVEVGLGHLALGRARGSLSGGERQRLGLAAALFTTRARTLHLLDEPATGLHESDLARLVSVLRRLTARGHLIVAAEHRSSLIAAADERIELGPGTGPAGGRVVATG